LPVRFFIDLSLYYDLVIFMLIKGEVKNNTYHHRRPIFFSTPRIITAGHCKKVVPTGIHVIKALDMATAKV